MNVSRCCTGGLLIILTLISISSNQNLPLIQKCKNDDKKCIVNVINDVIKLAAEKDVDELGLKRIDPYPLPKLNIEHGEGSAVELKINLRNATINGLGCVVIDGVNGFDDDPKQSVFQLNDHWKKLSMTGRYRISGKVLLLPISGQGFTNFTFLNTNFTAKLLTKFESRNGEDYLKIKNVHYKSTVERFLINLENLFNNKELSDNMNAILNENDQLILNEVKPSIDDVISKLIRDISNTVFDKHAYKSLFLQ